VKAMLLHISAEKIFRARAMHWLDSRHHFSFADYYDPGNMNFGVLRVLNDDLIAGHSGFDTHQHWDMEILSYMVCGELTHRDSLGNERTIRRGDVQYMSAGRGILHSELNLADETVRFLQIWVLPAARNLEPAYGEQMFTPEQRENRLLHIASGVGSTKPAPVRLNQDVNMYAAELDNGAKLAFPLAEGRQCYIVQIEGSSLINGISLAECDAMKAAGEDLSVLSILGSTP